MAHATLRKLGALHWYIPIYTKQGRSFLYIVIGIFLCTPNNPIADNMHACVLTVRFGLIVVVTFDWVIILLVCYAPGGPGCKISTNYWLLFRDRHVLWLSRITDKGCSFPLVANQIAGLIELCVICWNVWCKCDWFESIVLGDKL